MSAHFLDPGGVGGEVSGTRFGPLAGSTAGAGATSATLKSKVGLSTRKIPIASDRSQNQRQSGFDLILPTLDVHTIGQLAALMNVLLTMKPSFPIAGITKLSSEM